MKYIIDIEEEPFVRKSALECHCTNPRCGARMVEPPESEEEI